MAQIFQPRADAIARAALVGLAMLPVLLIGLGYTLMRSPYVTQQNVTREQPVPFSPTLAPGDQLETPIARAIVPVFTHGDVPCPPREHGRIRHLGPQPECGSAATLTCNQGSW